MIQTTNNDRTIIWSTINRKPDYELRREISENYDNITEDPLTVEEIRCQFNKIENIKDRLNKISFVKPILVIDIFEDLIHNDSSRKVRVIDSGNLADCFEDETFDLAEWYVNKDGDLFSYGVDRERAQYSAYFGLKADVPLSLIQCFFEDVEMECDEIEYMDEIVFSVGNTVLDVLGLSEMNPLGKLIFDYCE